MGLARWINNRVSADSRLADERMKRRMEEDRNSHDRAIENMTSAIASEKDKDKKASMENDLATLKKSRKKHTAGWWKNTFGMGRAMTHYREVYKQEKQAIKDDRKRKEMGMNRWNAFTTAFQKPKDLSGLKGKERKAAKEHNERIRLARAVNKGTIDKAKGYGKKIAEHVGKHKGKYIAAGAGLAALGAVKGFIGAKNAHQRKMAKMAYQDRQNRRSAMIGAVGAAALGLGKGVSSNQQGGGYGPQGGGGYQGYHPALGVQQQQQGGKGKSKLLGAAMNLASKNPQLSQMLLSGASKALGG